MEVVKKVAVFLMALIVLIGGLYWYRFVSDDSLSKVSTRDVATTTPKSFVLLNQQSVYQGYYSQPADQSSIKIIAKLIGIEKNGDDDYVTLDISPDQNTEKIVKILVARNDSLPFILIKQKTRDYDPYSTDYVVTRPNRQELISQLESVSDDLIVLVMSLTKISPDDPKYQNVESLIPVHNQYIDCNNQLVEWIKSGTGSSWPGHCQARTHQIYVVE